VLDRPADLLVADTGVIARRQLAGLCLIDRRPENVFRLVRGCQCVGVSGRRGEARGASGGGGSRIADVARDRESRPAKRAEAGCSLAIARERPSALNRVAWTGVSGSFRLEHWQHPLGAIGSPVCDKATVFFAQGYPIVFDTVVRCHFSTVIERTAPSSLACYSGRKIMV
jgi:hypothetical protein